MASIPLASFRLDIIIGKTPMFFRHQLPNGQIIAFDVSLKGREVTLTTTVQSVVVSRTFVLETDDFDPHSLAQRFLNAPLSVDEKLKFASMQSDRGTFKTRMGG